MTQPFALQHLDPQHYRQQTRRSTLIIAGVFIVLAMLMSSGAVMLFGTAQSDNFYWNMLGVIGALVITIVMTRRVFWSQPWMAAAVYGWQLKRNLMRITNIMHHVTSGAAAGDPTAMRVLRFYHLGLLQMHQLDGNSSSASELIREVDQHKAHMQALNLDTEQTWLERAWLDAVKKRGATPQ